MYLKKDAVENNERTEKEGSTRMWRTKLWEGDWDSFIDQTDKNYTKSNPLVSRLEMLKNSVDFGFPTLALKIFRTKNSINVPAEASPKNLRHLSKYQELLEHITDAQFLTSAFGSQYDVLKEERIKDKGEHLFYLLLSGAEEKDIDEFLEKRILNNMSLSDYKQAIKEKTEFVPSLSFEDYISLAYICMWYENDYKPEIDKIQTILQNLWFKKFNRDIEEIISKKSFNPSDDVNALQLVKERLSYNTNKPYPALIVSSISDEEKLNNLYGELRDALDHFSFLTKGNRHELAMEDIQNYVYRQKNFVDGEIVFNTKKNFSDERLSKKQDIVLNLYKSFHNFMERVEGVTPV